MHSIKINARQHFSSKSPGTFYRLGAMRNSEFPSSLKREKKNLFFKTDTVKTSGHLGYLGLWRNSALRFVVNNSNFNLWTLHLQLAGLLGDQRTFCTLGLVNQSDRIVYCVMSQIHNGDSIAYIHMYRYTPHNDVSVNDGPHIRRWSHKIIIL